MVFRFMDLPPEVRTKVYSYLLVSPQHPSKVIRKPIGLAPSILRVSRKVHSECQHILYTGNVFNAHPMLLASMPYLVEVSRPVVCRSRYFLIRRFYIEVRLDCDPFWTSEGLAEAFSGAHELHVQAWQNSFATCSNEVLQHFASVRRVRKATVEGTSISKEFAQWLVNVMQSGEDASMPLTSQLEYDVWTDGNR